MCDNIQNFFWRVVLRVPESCPKLALRCETGMIGMKWRVWLEKVALLVRIQNKKANTLCKRIYEEGKVKGWPGLSQEVSDICAEIGIPDVNHNVVENIRIKEAIFMHHCRAAVPVPVSAARASSSQRTTKARARGSTSGCLPLCISSTWTSRGIQGLTLPIKINQYLC